MNYLGVDTGGTFTDFVWLNEVGQLQVHKVLSTPEAPERAILQGIEDLKIPLEALRIVHGSTVATNAVLEKKGVRTAFITNRGFADLLTLARQNRKDLYELTPLLVAPPVPKELCLETGGRLSAEGELLEALSDADLEALKVKLERINPDAIAVNLLFSYLNPSLEMKIKAISPDASFVSLSSEVLPELGEYERGMATWLNAWVGPLLAGYLQRLNHSLKTVPIAVMQSSGETLNASEAAQQAVRMLLSGPAGGLVGASYIAGLSQKSKLLTFDMGGTSTDVAVVDGGLQLTTEGRVADYPVAVPMIDMHTIGAGGGSIAWVDEGGMLQLGPQSAGASPGPACYGLGASLPTVTDANLLLGHLLADDFLGGEMHLDLVAAKQSMTLIAEQLNCNEFDVAHYIIDIANANMVRALRVISVKKGLDTSEFSLVSFGGAGGLHVCELAQQLEMTKALVPMHGGVLSALGMLVARPGRQLSSSLLQHFDASSCADIEVELEKLKARGFQQLQQEQGITGEISFKASLDLRYLGQSYRLNLPWTDVATVSEAFHALHQSRYGHRMDVQIELVTLRLAALAPASDFTMPERHLKQDDVATFPEVSGVPCYQRKNLSQGIKVYGPAIISETVSTTWLAEDWSCELDTVGNLLLSHIKG